MSAVSSGCFPSSEPLLSVFLMGVRSCRNELVTEDQSGSGPAPGCVLNSLWALVSFFRTHRALEFGFYNVRGVLL